MVDALSVRTARRLASHHGRRLAVGPPPLHTFPPSRRLPPTVPAVRNRIVLHPRYQQTSAPRTLRAFRFYLPAMAYNGVLEGFLASVCTPADLRAQRRMTAAVSAALMATALAGTSAARARTSPGDRVSMVAPLQAQVRGTGSGRGSGSGDDFSERRSTESRRSWDPARVERDKDDLLRRASSSSRVDVGAFRPTCFILDVTQRVRTSTRERAVDPEDGSPAAARPATSSPRRLYTPGSQGRAPLPQPNPT
ncbi:hypothetical protein EDB86DRAFT_2974700 [Lactarius hatsudake]|nr:hypothetical protein EDB86DRAFT_2974700 [Lactarius hatsudake]